MSPGPDWTDVVQAIGTAVSAATSALLVYIAINFRDEVRAARRRPELRLAYDPTRDTTLFQDPTWNYDIHLRVENKPGQDRALGVSLELMGVESLLDTPALRPRPPQRPFAVAELDNYQSTTVDIAPNVGRRFLFVYHDTAKSEGKLELGLIPRAVESKRDCLPPGKYRMTMALTATNADATYWTTDVEFLGIGGNEQHDVSRLAVTAPVQVQAPTRIYATLMWLGRRMLPSSQGNEAEFLVPRASVLRARTL